MSWWRPESTSQGLPFNVRFGYPLDVISGRPQDDQIESLGDVLGTLGGGGGGGGRSRDVLGTNICRLGGALFYLLKKIFDLITTFFLLLIFWCWPWYNIAYICSFYGYVADASLDFGKFVFSLHYWYFLKQTSLRN